MIGGSRKGGNERRKRGMEIGRMKAREGLVEERREGWKERGRKRGE